MTHTRTHAHAGTRGGVSGVSSRPLSLLGANRARCLISDEFVKKDNITGEPRAAPSAAASRRTRLTAGNRKRGALTFKIRAVSVPEMGVYNANTIK